MKINHLSINIGKKEILKDITMSLDKNKIYVILGKNGSGKTTLLKAISKLMKINKGDIYIETSSIKDISYKEYSKIVSYLPQSLPSITSSVYELVSYAYKSESKFITSIPEIENDKIKETISKVGILDKINRPVCHLSGGEKLLAYFSLILYKNTEYVFMDEPYASLDIISKDKITNFIKELKNEGKSVVISVHDILLALELADEIILLDQGKLIKKSSKEEFINSLEYQKVFNSKIIETKDSNDNSYYVIKKN